MQKVPDDLSGPSLGFRFRERGLQPQLLPLEMPGEWVYASSLRLDGQPTVGLAIFQLPGSIALDTKKAVVKTLFEALLRVVLVVVVFLQNWRASSIPLNAVPVIKIRQTQCLNNDA
ncbi:Multidrug export protein AcrF [Gammaproteobacteria bacterium]|nr:Multidrug export protein AcrF [Gammaproteobacteria bacterium]